MSDEPRAPDPAARRRSLAIALAIACAALAATALVLILKLRAPSTPEPAPSSPRGAVKAPSPRGPSPLLSAVNRAEIEDEPGMYRVDGQRTLDAKIQVHRAAEQGAKVVAELPAGTVVDLWARRSGWTLVAWPDGAGGVLIGWVVLP